MNKDLYQAGIVAIPLLPKPESQLGLMMPNFAVFEQQFGKTKDLRPNLLTGIDESTDCVFVYWKLVRRVFFENGAFDEKELIKLESLTVPVDLLPAMLTHQRIKENLPIINLALSKLKFSDSLEYFTCEVNETVLDEIIAQESIEADVQ